MFFANMKIAVKSLMLAAVTAVSVAAVAWYATASSATINQTDNDALYAEQRARAVQQIGTHLLTISRARARMMVFSDIDSLVSGRDLIQERMAKIETLANDLSANMDRRLRASSVDTQDALMTEQNLVNNILVPWKQYANSLETGTLPRLDSAIRSLRENQDVTPVLQAAFEAVRRDMALAETVETAVETYSNHMNNEALHLSAVGDTATEALNNQLWLAAVGVIIVSCLTAFAFSYERYMRA